MYVLSAQVVYVRIDVRQIDQLARVVVLHVTVALINNGRVIRCLQGKHANKHITTTVYY